jgi:hypothetical protein
MRIQDLKSVSYFSKDVEYAVEWSMLKVFWISEAGDCYANEDFLLMRL